MATQDIPKRVVIVLLVLTIIVSFLGTLTFIEVYRSLSTEGNGGVAQGTVSLTVLDPNNPTGQPANMDSAGVVSINIVKQES